MSSSVLHDHIPHSVLLPNQPLFCLRPRVFGCISFVHILTHGQDKLSTKATKCVFLGYSLLQKGYRSYSPDINRYFISVDVTFFEDSSFFSSTAYSHVLDVLSIPLLLPSLDFPSPPMDAVTRPLQVSTHRPRPRPRPPTGPLVESSSTPQSSHALVPQSSDDLPISIRKCTCSALKPHHVYNFLSFHRLSLPYFAFISTFSSVSTPKSTSKALSHPGWKQTLAEEIDAL